MYSRTSVIVADIRIGIILFIELFLGLFSLSIFPTGLQVLFSISDSIKTPILLSVSVSEVTNQHIPFFFSFYFSSKVTLFTLSLLIPLRPIFWDSVCERRFFFFFFPRSSMATKLIGSYVDLQFFRKISVFGRVGLKGLLWLQLSLLLHFQMDVFIGRIRFVLKHLSMEWNIPVRYSLGSWRLIYGPEKGYIFPYSQGNLRFCRESAFLNSLPSKFSLATLGGAQAVLPQKCHHNSAVPLVIARRTECNPHCFCCFLCVVGYPPDWWKRPRYIE